MNRLSSREIDVLRQFSEGYSLRQVADKLFLSEETIRSHKKSIYRKLDINNSIQLGIWIERHLSLTNLEIAK